MNNHRRATTHDVLQAVREMGETSRTALAQRMGVGLSTISVRVDELINDGLVEEAGDGVSSGGRRPRLLKVRREGGAVLAVDLGSHHARLGIMDLAGAPLTVIDEPILVADGPEATLELVAARLSDLVETRPGWTLRGIGIGVPGPVSPLSHRVTSPSRMPGWHDFQVNGWLAERFGVPTVVDNDANLLALGDYRTRWAKEGVRHLVGVKMGRGIGCGIISGGSLYHGAGGAAGDISHVRVPSVAGEELRCLCGNLGCLETVASGGAILRRLDEAGHPAADMVEVVERVRRSDPTANLAVRTAGRHLGEVLAVVVNFFNPEVVLIGGALGQADPLIASVRAAIYERCLPMASQAVEITTVAAGPDATLTGATARILDHLAVGAR